VSQSEEKEVVRHFTIRLPVQMHQQATQKAAKEHISLNSWFLRLADASLCATPSAQQPQGAQQGAPQKTKPRRLQATRLL